MCILLEGALEPFWVWTDHKDLKNISSAKRLSSLQARWAFFFDRFCFPLSYRPGSKNIKPDALSRLFASPGREAPPDTISPRGVMVASVSWGVERRVREALWGVEVLRGCPTGLFVPGPLLPSVLEWSHSSRLVCHPGVQRTLASVLYSSWLLALFASRTRLLTSLPNASATFRKLMSMVLGKVPYYNVYLDNVVIYSSTWAEHMSDL